MAAGIVRARRVHSGRDRCFLCATDEEIVTAMSMNAVRTILALLTRKRPTIRWQGVSCPFEEN